MCQEIGHLQRLEQLGDRLCPIFKRMQYAAHSLSGESSITDEEVGIYPSLLTVFG
jgi:hypothetical protein